jgi:hypothetical protein
VAQETLPRRLPRARAHNMTHATRGERGAPENASWRVLGHGGHPEDTGISFLSPGQAQGAVSCGDIVCQDTRGLGVLYPHRIRCSQDSGDTRCPPRPRIPYPPCPTTPTCVFRRGSRLPAVFLISHTRLFEAKPRPRVYFGIPIRFTDDVMREVRISD